MKKSYFAFRCLQIFFEPNRQTYPTPYKIYSMGSQNFQSFISFYKFF